mgnify:FL=1
MKKRTILLGVAVLVLGLFLLPQAMSTFNDQHTWQDTAVLDCQKCHPDIVTELEGANNFHHDSSALVAAGATEASTTVQACMYCHQTDYTYGTDTNDPFTGNAHAALTMECLDCHSGDGDTNLAGDQTGIGAKFTGGEEAHIYMYDEATADTLLLEANEACIACHTAVTVQITYSGEFSVIEIDASLIGTGGWDVSMDYSL